MTDFRGPAHALNDDALRRAMEDDVRSLRASVERLNAEHDRLRRLLEIAHEREAYFVEVLGVADGGVYRNDWDAAIRRVLARRDQLESERDRLEAAIDRHRADIAGNVLEAESPTDRILYAVLQQVRDERLADAAPGGRDEEGSE